MCFQLPAGALWKAPSGRGTPSYAALIQTAGGCSASLIGPRTTKTSGRGMSRAPLAQHLLSWFFASGLEGKLSRWGEPACKRTLSQASVLSLPRVQGGSAPTSSRGEWRTSSPNLDHLISLRSSREEWRLRAPVVPNVTREEGESQ